MTDLTISGGEALGSVLSKELDNIVAERASVKRVDSIANCAGLKIVEPLVGGWKERLGEYRQRPTELVCGLARGWE